MNTSADYEMRTSSARGGVQDGSSAQKAGAAAAAPPHRPHSSLYSMFAKRNPFRKKSPHARVGGGRSGNTALKHVSADLAGLTAIHAHRRWCRGVLSALTVASLVIGLFGALFPSIEDVAYIANALVCLAGIGCVLRLYSVKALRAGLADPLYEGRSSLLHSPYVAQMCLELCFWAFAPPFSYKLLGGGGGGGSSDDSTADDYFGGANGTTTSFAPLLSSAFSAASHNAASSSADAVVRRQSDTWIATLDYLAYLRLYNILLYLKGRVLGRHLFVRALATLGHLPVTTGYFIRTAMVYEKARTSLLCVAVTWGCLGLAFHQAEGRPMADSFYFVFLTAATIGYGETAPQTHMGRIISFAAWAFGLLVLGWAVSLFQQSMRLTEAERNLYLMHRANKRSRLLRGDAAKTLQLAWRFYSVNRLKRLVNGRTVASGSAIVLAASQPAVNADGTSNIHVAEVLGGAVVGSSNNFAQSGGGGGNIGGSAVIVGRSFQQAMQSGGVGSHDGGGGGFRPIVVEDGATRNDGTDNPITVASLHSSDNANNGGGDGSSSSAPRVVISTSANSRENIALSYAAWRLRSQCQKFRRRRNEYREDVAIIIQSMAAHEQRVYGTGGPFVGSSAGGFGALGLGGGGGGMAPPFDPSALLNPYLFTTSAAAAVDGGSPSMTLRSPSERSTPNGIHSAGYPAQQQIPHPFASSGGGTSAAATANALLAGMPMLNFGSGRRRGSSQLAAATVGAVPAGAVYPTDSTGSYGAAAAAGLVSRRRTLSEISVNDDALNTSNTGGGRGVVGSAPSATGAGLPPTGLPPSAATLVGSASGTNSATQLKSSGNSIDHMEMPRSPRRAAVGNGSGSTPLHHVGPLHMHGVSMEDVLQLATHTAAVSAAAITHQHHAAMGLGLVGAQSPHHHMAGQPVPGQPAGAPDAIASRKLHQEMKRFTTILTQVADQQAVLLMAIQELKADVKQVKDDQERMRRNPMRHLFLEGGGGGGGGMSGSSSQNNSVAYRRGHSNMGMGGGGNSYGNMGALSNPSNPNSPGMGYASGGGQLPSPGGAMGTHNSSFNAPPGGSLLYRPGTLMDNGSFYAPPPLASTVMGEEEVPHFLRSSSNNPAALGSRESLQVAGYPPQQPYGYGGSMPPPFPASSAPLVPPPSQFTVVNTANNSSNGSQNGSLLLSAVPVGSLTRQNSGPMAGPPSFNGGGVGYAYPPPRPAAGGGTPPGIALPVPPLRAIATSSAAAAGGGIPPPHSGIPYPTEIGILDSSADSSSNIPPAMSDDGSSDVRTNGAAVIGASPPSSAAVAAAEAAPTLLHPLGGSGNALVGVGGGGLPALQINEDGSVVNLSAAGSGVGGGEADLTSITSHSM